MARKDIELRIRAKDDASRNAKKIADALKLISSDGLKAAESASKTGGALSALAADVGRLQGRASNLKVFGSMVGEMEKARTNVERLERQIEGSGRAFASLRNQTTDLSRASGELRRRIDAESAANTTLNNKLVATTQSQKANNEAVRAATRAQEALNGARRKGITVAGNKASEGIGLETGPTSGTAQKSFATFLAADIAAANATKRQLETTITGLKASIDSSKASIGGLNAELRDATAAEKEFTNETMRAGNAVLAARADLHQAQQTLDALEGGVQDANKALGTFAFTQEDVARAADRAETELRQQARALEAMQKFSTGGKDFADPATAAALRKQSELVNSAREDWKALEVESKRLGASMRATSGNATEQVDAFNRMTTASRAAKDEFERQAATLARLRGSAQGSFGAWAKAFNPIVSGAAAASNAQNKQAAASQNSANAANRIAPAMRQASGAIREVGQSSDTASVGLLNFGRSTRTTLSMTQRLRGELLSLTASFLGFQAALSQGRGSVDAFRELESVQSRLGAVMKQDTGAVAKEVSWLRTEANRLGIEFGVLGNQYAKFAVAADAANFTHDNTRKMFLAVAEAGRVNKLSLDQLQGTFLAIEQIISKGKFTSEEVRRQLGDRLPGAFNILADAMGVTTAQLDKMMSNGELLSTEGNLLKFADELTRRFGPQLGASLDTFTTDLGRAQNSVFNMRLAIAQGLIPALREALKSFTAFSQSKEGADIFRQIGDAAGKLIGVLVEIPKYFDLIMSAAKTFLALKFGQWVASLGGALKGAAGAFTAYSQATLSATIQGQRLTLTQRTLMLAVFRANNSLLAHEARLRASASASASARLGTLAFANTIGLLRNAMLGAAAIARTMWAAIGGPIGIGVAAVSLIYANWKSDADKATDALHEHERQLAAVRQAYQSAGVAAKNFSDEVKGVELPGAVKALKVLMGDFEKSKRDLANAVAGPLGGTNAMVRGDFGETYRHIGELTEAFMSGSLSGSLSAKHYGEALAEIYKTTEDASIRKVLESAGKAISELAHQEGTLSKQAALVKLLGGNVEELTGYVGQLADESELLGEVIEQTNQSLDNTEFVDTYTAAIDKLKEAIPELAEEMKRLKEQTELNQTAWKGLVAAWNAADYSKIFEIAALWGRATENLSSQAQGKFLDSFGAGSKDVIQRIIYIEGGQKGGGPDTSSARGIGQFTKGTWMQYLDRLYPELRTLNETQKLSLRTSEEHAMKIMEAFTRDNQNQLLRRGLNAGPTETYLAHFLGAGDAIKVLLANPDELAANIVDANSVAANPAVFKAGMTIQDLIGWSAGKMGDGSKITGTGQTENEKESADQAKATKKRLDDLDFEISQQRLKNAEKEREAAIEEALRAARAENKNITDEELAVLREKTGALWDQQNIRMDLEQSEERVNQLYQLRQQILEQMQMAQEAGDLTAVEALKEQILNINESLTETIQKTIAMWEALGGPEADAAIAKLKTMDMTIKAARVGVGAFGISLQTWDGIIDGAADGLVGAFDEFAKAIANGENAFKAFGQTALQVLAQVLQEIAKAILKQMILNALRSMGVPIPGGPMGHTGGLVGSKAIGSGNAIGRPQWVSDAFTGVYHTGGLAGYAPDEVSATLKENEEILTEEDPRHRFNLGGERSADQGTRLKQVLAIGDAEIANAMGGAAGEQVQLTMIKRNAPTIRRMLGL